MPDPPIAVQTTPIKVQVDAERIIRVNPERPRVENGLAVQWTLDAAGDAPLFIAHMKPLETALLVPDPTHPWHTEHGMLLDPANPPRAKAQNNTAEDRETDYRITVEFADENMPRTLIGSVLIVE